MYRWNIVLIILFLSIVSGMGHPMPHSIFSFDVKSDRIFAQLKVPLKELQLALPFDVTEHTETLLEQERKQQLSNYFLVHIRPKSVKGLDWNVAISNMSVTETEQESTGKYKELTVDFILEPPSGESVRDFYLYYDVILHQVVTHKVFVMLKQDWQNGITGQNEKGLGVIELDIAANKIPPMHINLDEGSTLKGFVNMIWLGINHIAEGFDHLLFLFVLLLPATLNSLNGRWTTFVGTRKSVINILKIVTAFTIGHSLSLFLGAKQWLLLPQQPVEIAIAITILITALHALRPLFPHKEMNIALVFGLIHGLAFSTVLSELNLDTKELAFSILGYNIGIELMQIFVIVLTMPWIIVLSKNNHFKWIRIFGALVAIVAALAWVYERIVLEPNFISKLIDQILSNGKWLVLGLMLIAILSIFMKKSESENIPKTN